MKFLTKALFLAFAAFSIDTVDAQDNKLMKGLNGRRGDNQTMSDRQKEKLTNMTKQEFGVLWNMTNSQRSSMATNQTQWTMMLTAFKQKFSEIISDYDDNFKRMAGRGSRGGRGGRDGKGQRGGKGPNGQRDGKSPSGQRDGKGPQGRGGKGGRGGRDSQTVQMLGSNEECSYNYQCETECCLQPRRKGGKGGKGGRRGGKGRDLMSNEFERMLQGRGQGRGQGGRGDDDMRSDAKKVCVPEKHCDDDDVGYTVWQFFAGLLMGSLAVAVCLQYWFYKKQITQIQSIEHIVTEMHQGHQLPQETSQSPWGKENQAEVENS